MAPTAAATKASSKSAGTASALKAKAKDKPAGADIRSFFGKSSQTTQTGSSQDKAAGSSQKNAISIDEDDAPTPVKKPAPAPSKTPTKPQTTTAKEPAKPAAAAKAVPAAKATPASAKRKKVAVSDDEEEDSPPKKKPASGSSKPRASTTKKSAVVLSSDDEPVVKKPAPKKAKKPDDEDWEMDDAEDAKPKAKPRKSNGARVVDSDSDDVEAKPTPKPKPRKSAAKAVVDSDSDEVKPKPKPRKSVAKTVVDSDEEDVKPKPKAKPRKSATAKDGGDDEDESKPKAKAKPRQSAAAKLEDDDGDVKPSVEDKPKPKNNFAAMKAARAAGPSAPGSKPVPEGEPNCFAGLTFVFTGELSSLAREEAQDLAKRYGGRVTGAPSGKTSYVIVGANAGASKLKALEKHGIPTLDEDGFLNLIATRKGFLDEKTKEKMRKEEEKLKEQVRELEERERKATKAAKKALKEGTGGKKVYDPSEQLWTTKYAPANLREICGNKAAVEKLRVWLEKWQENMKTGFKKPGKDAMGVFRAVLITGPPGIGKTTTAHLVAKMEGYTPLELNASDARSKKLIENGANIDNRSLDGWMAGEEGKTNAVGVAVTERTCLIMDEVDGMSAGDRGGVGALNALIKKTKIPIICIANDGRAQKLQPLKATTFNMTFSKPQVQQIRSRIMTIVMREGMKVPPNVIDQLIAGAQSDIRQVLNMLSTWKLSNDTMDFDESKHLTKMNEKYSVMTPFNVITKVLGPYMFSSTSRETLSEKMEYYFHDHSFVPLFMQENYLRSTPARLQGEEGPFRDMKHLELMEKAASSLSDADLVDAMIHGNDQHWSLMPLHAVVSTVRPAYHMYGTGAHWGGQDGIRFPAWLGQNSKEQKLRRQLAEVQIKMRLRATGSKAEVRLGYLPTLHNALVRPLQLEGADAIDDVIAVMDEYHLNREDWDTLGELGLGKLAEKETVAQIKTATKTAFTKRYNAGDHPVAFHKQEFGKAPKKIAAAHGPAPDLEDAFDIEDDDVVADDKEAASDDDNIENDKLIKKPRLESRFRNAKRQCNQTAPEEPQEHDLGTFTNPTIDGNYADPFVFSFNNAYYLLATESDGSVSIFKSNNFANWRGAEHKRLWMPPNPPVWAPEMHNIDGNFYVYCALPDGPADADHRTHVLKGTDPTDPTAPFEDLGVISTPDLNYMIDATVLKYGGKNYLIWSGKENPQTETIQHIYIAEMSSPSTLIGERVDLHAPFHADGSRIDWQWSPNQYGVNEGPQILQNGNQTFLIYSACGSWDPCYSLAIMGLDGDDKNPLDPAAWWRNDDGPIFTKSDKTVGTGHASFTTDTRGTPYIIYHAWPVEASGGWGARTVYTQPFEFGSDGRPIFPSPVAQGVEVPAPAGF